MSVHFKIHGIPAVLYGNKSNGVYLYIHGQRSCKEAAETFASIVSQKGWQVLSIDLPEHGERKHEQNRFFAWHIIPELNSVLTYVKEHWQLVSLRAHSIGAYFSMQSFQNEAFFNAQLVSPILDMKLLYEDMMRWASISPEILEKASLFQTSFGETLYWDEYHYALEHPLATWKTPTDILLGEKDQFTSISTAKAFANEFSCRLTLVSNCEHWFHTDEQLVSLSAWTTNVTPEFK